VTDHTPGPWVARRNTREESLLILGPTTEIAMVSTDDPPTEEEMANAFLLAAAPDMLQELKRAEVVLANLAEVYDTPMARENLEAIRAAIAKAEGREP